MATVEVKNLRIQPATFALYRTSAGGDESVIVRRKVVDPTDVNHSKSRKLKVQRWSIRNHTARPTPSY